MTAVSPEIARSLAQARDGWVRKLIDTSRRNQLLFFRDLPRSMVELDPSEEPLVWLLDGKEVGQRKLAQGSADDVDEVDIGRSLEELRKKALSNREEKGVETLHLAVGMATWPASDQGTPFNAPVLLVPLTIQRAGANATLRVRMAGESRVNPVLLHTLREDFGLKLSSEALLESARVGDDDEGWALSADKLNEALRRQVVKAIPHFRIKPRAVIANFYFARMPMVEDLKHNLDSLCESDLVRALTGDRDARSRLEDSVPENSEPWRLDERHGRDDYHVLTSDSSQHAAIVVAERGASLVIQGPPGTGKSQTIANLIAQSIALGKRVLFVAEKRAALDAVVKRLSDPTVALGHLVLDLHGADVSRKAVMAQLKTMLDQLSAPVRTQADDTGLAEFEKARQRLNSHAVRVNHRHSPLRKSFIEVAGELLRLPSGASTAASIPLEKFKQLDQEQIARLEEYAQLVDGRPDLYCPGGRSPWVLAKITAESEAIDLVERVNVMRSVLIPRVKQCLRDFSDECGRPISDNLSDIGLCIEAIGLMEEAATWCKWSAFNLPLNELATALDPYRQGRFAVAWAFLSNPEFRRARRQFLDAVTGVPRRLGLYAALQHLIEVRRTWKAVLGSTPIRERASGTALKAATTALVEALQPLRAKLPRTDLAGPSLDAVLRSLDRLYDCRQDAYMVPKVQDVRRTLDDYGLSALLAEPSAHPHKTVEGYAIPGLRRVLLEAQLQLIMAAAPELISFDSTQHGRGVADFRRLDDARVRMASARVRERHRELATESLRKFPVERDLVAKEAGKKARHLPLRRLLEQAPSVLTRIAPCWVASPLSVSQLLPPTPGLFDLVVFDEASQIPPEDAVPALYRAKQVVAAGDQHQLPPTTFFASSQEEEVEESFDDVTAGGAATAGAATVGFESLLAALDAFLPNRLLEWHYRSEDERLITYSNSEVYSRRLITFPSVRSDDALCYEYVQPDSRVSHQEESVTQEVLRVVDLVRAHFRHRPHESLGVIALSIKHADRLDAAISKALRDDPAFARAAAEEGSDRFFVKNLERVQGDERDAIILSLGYGKSPGGVLPLRFGPLLQEAGYRRLNVAITRARRRMTVVTSFEPEDIDLSRTRSRGVHMLAGFLRYAKSGGVLLHGAVEPDIPLNAFEADVKDALERRGLKVQAQFGALRFRIDLVVMHPQNMGQPVLAVECDGATYHSSYTARDRDKIRQEQLERLGWVFHRIWSSDWFRHRDREVDRLIDAYNVALAKHTETTKTDVPVPPKEPHARLPENVASPVPPVTSATDTASPGVRVRRPIEEYTIREIDALFDQMAIDGVPIVRDVYIRQATLRLGYQRTGKVIKAILSQQYSRWKQRRH